MNALEHLMKHSLSDVCISSTPPAEFQVHYVYRISLAEWKISTLNISSAILLLAVVCFHRLANCYVTVCFIRRLWICNRFQFMTTVDIVLILDILNCAGPMKNVEFGNCLKFHI